MESSRMVRSGGHHKSFANLSEDIVIAIFLRLPSESFARCRCVCKSWYSWTQNPFLLQELLFEEVRRLQQLQLLVHENLNPNGVNFLMLNIGDKEVRRIIPLKHPEKDFKVKNSCNGLLCLSRKKLRHPVLIYNPITREGITLPPFKRKALHPIFNHRLTLGFDTISETYKVVRTFEDRRFERRYYMISVGREDKWKRLSPPSGVPSHFISHSTHWNGTVFWTIAPIKHSNCCLLAFDLHAKTFQVITFPNPRHKYCFYELSLLHMGEYLDLVEYVDTEITLWKVTGEKIGEYSLILECRYDTRMKLEKNYQYKVVGKLKGGGFLLQVTVYGKNERVYFTKFDPRTGRCEALDIPGVHRKFTSLINYKSSLVSPTSI